VKIIKERCAIDILVLVLTFALTVIFDLVVAIAVGIVVHYAFVMIKKLVKRK